jgi:hypothetical protein
MYYLTVTTGDTVNESEIFIIIIILLQLSVHPVAVYTSINSSIELSFIQVSIHQHKFYY